MHLPFRTVSTVSGVIIFLLVLLLPLPVRLPERDVHRDIQAVRQAECRYRGIAATFQDATRAYLLETYEEGEVIRWQGEPSPRNPESETLVTAWCRVGPAKPVKSSVVPDSTIALRRGAGRRIPVTWRYGTLAAVQIDPANDFARDAIDVFRLTVDRFIRAMAVIDTNAKLRRTASALAPAVEEVAGGTVLLREDPPDTMTPAPGWCYVRIPSTRRRGWIEAERLITVEDEQ